MADRFAWLSPLATPRRFITRPVAFLLAGEMAAAYFLSHAPGGFWPLLNRGEPAVLFCFVWLYFAAAGPGPWSLDARRGRRGRST